MPINRGGGIPGAGGIVATPGRRFGSVLGKSSKPFRSSSFSTINVSITGVTKDSTGAVLGSCIVQLFRASDNSFRSQSVSDASGNYVLYPDVSGPFYIVAYKAGAPDVAGTTVNTLLPT